MPPRSPDPRPVDPFRGVLLMCLGVGMFPFLNGSIKLLTAHYPMIEIVWARFAGHLLVMALIFMPRRGLRLFATRRLPIQILRSLFLLASTGFYVLAIRSVPLATASAIGFTTPIMVTALSVPLLREPVGPRRWAAVIVGFIGALVIIRPGSGLTDPAVLLVIASSACYALYQVATRRTGITESAETGIVYAALVGTVVTSLIVGFDFRVPDRLVDGLLMVGLGCFGGVGHYFVIRAFQQGSAASISALGYIELVGSTIVGYFVFGNFPDAWTWVGAAIIIASGFYIAMRERRLRGG